MSIGAASALPYLGLAALSRSFVYGEGHAGRPILAVVGLLLVAWAGYAAALAAVVRASRPPAAGRAARHRLAIVLGFSAVFRLILAASTPIQEIDYYRYLWDGRSLLAGINPFALAPAEIDRLGERAAPGSLVGRAWQLSHESRAVRTIFERIHHRDVPTIYPPFSQAVFALAAWLTPAEAPLRVHVGVLKGMLVGFDLGVVVALASLLVRTGRPASWSLAYGWSPLALKEVANTAHLDAIAVCFTVLAALALVRAARPAGDASLRGTVLGSVALALATLSKSYPLVLVPLVGAFVAARLRLRAVAAAAAFAAVLALGYAPFVGGREAAEHSPWAGLSAFMARWQKNDFLFMLAHENLRPPGEAGHDRWFVLVPAPVREAVSRHAARPLAGAIGAPGADPSFLLTQLVMGLVLGGIAVSWSLRVYRRPDVETLLRGMALVLVWGWLLSAIPHPWYLTWCLPFLLFAGAWSWFLLTATAFLYYLRFWMEYRALSAGGDAVAAALARFDYGVVWVEYVPVFVALLVESVRRRLTPREGMSADGPNGSSPRRWGEPGHEGGR